MIKKCNCKADDKGNTNGAQYQDKRYGKGQRVCNLDKDKNPRCTVCGRMVI